MDSRFPAVERQVFPLSEENIFHLLTQEYYQFTSAEKRVADYILSNGTQTQAMSISDLAGACGVAEATISRFCRRLRYNSYAAFKLAVSTSTFHQSVSNPLSGDVTPEDTIPSLARKVASSAMDAIAETQALIVPHALQTAAEILGLRRYLKTAPKNELQSIVRSNPDYFYQLAPWALALGVDRTFAERFGNIRLPQCSYLATDMDGHLTAREWALLLRDTVNALDRRQKRLPLDKLLGK